MASVSTPLNTKEVLSVVVEILNEKHLWKLDTRHSLKEVIQALCSEFKIPNEDDQFALVMSIDETSNRYINESNRGMIQDASMLKLVHSPHNMAKIIINSTKAADNIEVAAWALNKLQDLALDPLFSKQFVEIDGMKVILDLITSGKIPHPRLNNCLSTLNSMMEHKFVRNLEDITVTRVISFVNESSNSDTVVLSLAILERLVAYGGYSYIHKSLKMHQLIKHISNKDNESVQTNVLALINAMARTENKKILQTMASKHSKELINNEVLKKSTQLSSELCKELYEYQSLVLSLKETKLNNKIDPSGSDAERIIELNNIVKEDTSRHSIGSLLDDNKDSSFWDKACTSLQDFTIANPLPAKRSFLRSKSSSTVRRNNAEMHFQVPRSVTLDFTQSGAGIPISRLALDNMLYFARRYPKQYVRMLLAEEASSQSFPIACERITKLVCCVMGVKRSKVSIRKYQPLLFKEPAFLEEVFCRMLLQLGKTRRDMKARTSADQEKVMSVLQRQLKESLSNQPITWTDLSMQLHNFNYTAISELWLKEIKAKDDLRFKTLPSILQLKENFKEDMIDLICQQRLNFLTNGTHFPKHNMRNLKTKPHTVSVNLAPNQKSFHFHEEDEDGRIVPNSSGKICMSDMSSVIVGKKCPHVKEAKNYKPEFDWAFSMVLDVHQGYSFDLIAPDQLTFDYWIDGINVLLGREMNSKTMASDLEKLVDMEVRLQLLDVNTADILSEPPPIPASPPNYDFHFTAD